MEHNRTLLSQLASGEVILGDGSYIMTLEIRGYAMAGQWAPEAAAEHPLAVEQLVVELSRAGADITQTFTFWCHEDSLPEGCKYSCDQINQAACDIKFIICEYFRNILELEWAIEVALDYGLPVGATMGHGSRCR